jgi:hypothetical protein
VNRTICSSAGTQRTLFGLDGTLMLTSALLGTFVSSWYLAIAAFVAVNQLMYATVGACPASLLLGRACSAGEHR